MVAGSDVSSEAEDLSRYPSHRDLDVLLRQAQEGLVHRCRLTVSKHMPSEATVRARLPVAVASGRDAASGVGGTDTVETTVIVSGRRSFNRAMHGDDVAVEVCCGYQTSVVWCSCLWWTSMA